MKHIDHLKEMKYKIKVEEQHSEMLSMAWEHRTHLCRLKN